MPFRLPFTTPFFNYRYHKYMPNQYYSNLNKISSTNNNSNISSSNSFTNNVSNNGYFQNSNNNSTNNSNTNPNIISANCDATSDSNSEHNSDYFFEILGLKLYFDDVLIICILFFLYSEGVKDDELFLCLILLLLT